MATIVQQYLRAPVCARACQTEVTTQTFIDILNINRAKHANSVSTAVQATRLKGDMSYLEKKKGIHIHDFGQNVHPQLIHREF